MPLAPSPRPPVCAALVALLWSIGPASASAQLTLEQFEGLAAAIEASAEAVDPDRLPDPEGARQQVLDAIQSVRDDLARSTDTENFDAWMDYLDLDPLATAIRDGEEGRELARRAGALRERLIGVWPGLERASLRRLRESLKELIAATRFGDPEEAPELIDRQLRVLADRVRDLDPTPSAEDVATLSRILEVLRPSRQAGESLARLGEFFSRPNVLVSLGEPLIQAAVRRSVNQNEPVRDCILGTRLVGQGWLRGAVTADLLPARGAARVRLTLSARFHSRNTGYNGPVRLQTLGDGCVNASRVAWIDDAGVRLDPVSATAQLDSRVTAIEHPLKLVRNIARKRAARQQPLAERIAAGRLRRRVEQQFTEQTSEAARSPGRFTAKDALVWFLRLDVPEPTQTWQSTEDLLTISASVRRPDQLAAALPAPELPKGFDAAFQIHESMVDNAFASYLGGRTVNQRQIDRLLELVGRAPPERGEEGQGDKPTPFEIDFARLRPVIFEARGDRLRLGIRGTRFEQGRRSLERALEVTATYRPESLPDGTVRLVRDEEVDVDFPGRGRLTVSQTALRGTIKQSFDDVFPATMLDRELTVPEGSRLDALSGQTFRPTWVDAEQGWLSVAIRGKESGRSADQARSLSVAARHAP